MPPVLFLKHTDTQLLWGISCLSISKLIFLETTLQNLPTWLPWSSTKYLWLCLGVSSNFPSLSSGYLQDHPSTPGAANWRARLWALEGTKHYQLFFFYKQHKYFSSFVKKKFGIHSQFPQMQISHGYYLAPLVESKLTIQCGTELASAHSLMPNTLCFVIWYAET